MKIVAKALILVAALITSVEVTNIALDSSNIVATSEYGQWRRSQSDRDGG